LYRCLLHDKRLIEGVRALPDGGRAGFTFTPWGLVWLEKEGLFGAGEFIHPSDTEQLEYTGTPMPAECREVMLTRAEAARYFQLLLDGHTLETMAKEMNFPDMDLLPGSGQLLYFLDWAADRRILGREVLRMLVDAAKAHRGKPGWVEWRFELSLLGPMLVQELAHVPVDEWPEWYGRNGRRLYWDPVTEKYKLQLELR
jgi:hypothetical protein